MSRSRRLERIGAMRAMATRWARSTKNEPGAVTKIQRFYDGRAAFYDAVIASSWFSPLVWGCPADAYRRWYSDATSGGMGRVLDVPCGTLVWSHGVLSAPMTERVVHVDRSGGMLSAAKKRHGGGAFVHGDAFSLPFGDATFDTVLCSGLLHVIGTDTRLIAELRRVTAPGGTLRVYTLVRTRRPLGIAALAVMRAFGQVAPPEHADDVCARIGDAFNVEERTLRGAMLFVVARKAEVAGRT